MGKKAIIIGAGPAGLTAAYELLKRTDITPVILEKSGDIGGISKTINYKGNRMDIGGHRFFSKSDRVMNWWLNIMPLQKTDVETVTINYQNKSHSIYTNIDQGTGSNESPGLVMLLRKRLSRIYFLRKFFNYPIQLSIDTLKKLGLVRTFKILLSYLLAQVIRRKPEKSLEDFLINRFGRQLYLLFFKDYTEKVWGVPCKEISAEWGAQRIKGVSISKAIQHAAQMVFKRKHKPDDIHQKDTETSLIEQFLYPALGPGQLWEEVARQIEVLGGKIILHQDVQEIKNLNNSITAVIAINNETGEIDEYTGDYFFSTMPVQELIAGMDETVPDNIKEIAAGLQYRDFITVGVLLEKLSTTDTATGNQKTLDLKDTWIYIQEKDVKVGRLQLFNNWSPYMVNKPGTVLIGMEYFCNKGDEFWQHSDIEIQSMAILELEKMGLASVYDALDSTVQRVEKTYPAYFGTYNQFDKLKEYINQFGNLFLVGRNGMHKYNNSDHSMLTAMTAVDNICVGITSKENIWAINTEQEYHEEKATSEHSEPNQEVIKEIYSGISFKDFVWNKKANRTYLIIAIIAILIQWILFKYLYPFASFISGDSYTYIDAAYRNLPVNTYPIGYSRFLRIFSAFSTSDTALVSFQYLTLQGFNLFFLFTLFYFYNIGRLVRNILYVFVVFNPVFLYLANYVSSDTLFYTLSIHWFTLLLWIIHKPTVRIVVIQCLVLFFAFTIRYNALIYPVIASLALMLSKQQWKLKLAGIAGSVLLIGLFVWTTSNHYERITGKRQFSPFTGWQLANNALYAYKFVDTNNIKPVPPRFKELDGMVRSFFDSTRNNMRHPDEVLIASTVYMWDTMAPLRVYSKLKTQKFAGAGPVTKWAMTAPELADYGSYLIRQYPVEYTKYYLLPNTAKYFLPPVEFLSAYNMDKDSVAPIAQSWFGYKNTKVKNRLNTNKVIILDWFPNLVFMINMGFLFVCVGYLVFKGWKKANDRLKKTILFIASIWCINFGFSVFASPIALRFQLFPIIILFMFTAILSEFIYKIDSYDKQKALLGTDHTKPIDGLPSGEYAKI